MTVIHYVVDPASPHGRAVVSFTRSFLRFAYDVFKRYRLEHLKYLIVTDRDGAVNPKKYTKDSKVIKLINSFLKISGICANVPTGLYDVNENAIVLCLRLHDLKDKVLSIRATSHEFVHFMIHPDIDRVIDGFVRALASDIPEFRDAVEVVTACYNKAWETIELGSEARKRLAELMPELKTLEDICISGFNKFKNATWLFVSQILAEYIALNYFVFLHKLPVLRIGSILDLPYIYSYYVDYIVFIYMETVASVASDSAYAYHRLRYPEKPVEEATRFEATIDEKVGLFMKKLRYGDHPKLKGFIHETFLSILERGTVFPADLAPKYPELYGDVVSVVRAVQKHI
jgi:hypothetical protein